MFGAGDEARTRDIQFGKLKLYQLSYTRTSLPEIYCLAPSSMLVEGEGFEPSYSERTDLQSVAFNHSATPPLQNPGLCALLYQVSTHLQKKMVPDVGIELTTFALQVRCSTN